MNKQLFTINEAAKLLGVSIKTLRRWDQKGLLQAQRTIGNQRRYELEDLEKLKGKKIKSIVRKKQTEIGRQVTIAEAATFLGVSVKTLRRWEHKGIITSHRSPTNQRFFLTNELSSLKQVKHEPEATPTSVSVIATLPVDPEQSRRARNDKHFHPFAMPHMKVAQAVFPVIGIVLAVAALGGTLTMTQIGLPMTKLLSYLPENFMGGTKNDSLSQVLQSATQKHDYAFRVNVPAEFMSTASVAGTLTAPNILYSVVAGDNITISGDPQNPTISADLNLTAGDGITLTGDTITNDDPGSAQNIFKNIKVGSNTITAGSNTDTLEFVAGSNITLSTDTSNKKITIAGSGSSGGISGIQILEGGTTVVNSATVLDFLAGDFDVGESPSGEGNIQLSSTLTSVTGVAGNFSIGGTTTLNGLTYTWPGSQGADYILQTNGSGTLSWIDSGTLPSADKWDSTLGSIYPKNASVLDLLIGGTATTSAKFAVINVNSGTPTATLSAGVTGGAYLTAAGTLQTTAFQNLTLGGDSTGNVSITPKNGSGTLALSVGAITIGANTGATSASPTCVSVTNGIVTGTGGCSAGVGGSIWTLDTNTGTIYPINNTMDLLIGGVSTNSAKFAVVNVAGGTPIASVSAGTNGAAFLSATGNLQTTAKQSLTLGGGDTGNIVLSGFSTGIIHSTNGVLSSSAINLASSDVTGILPIANGGTNKNLTLSNGGIVWSDADSFEILSANANAGLALVSGGGATPSWFAPTQGSIIFSGANGALSQDNASFFFDDTNNRLGLGGNSNLLGTLDVRATLGTLPVATVSGQTSFAGLVIDNSGVGDLFTASKSGTSKFTVLNNGNISWAGESNFQNILATNATAARTYTFPDASGTLCVSGQTCATSGIVGYWQRTSGALAPANITDDLLLGSTSTNSARFAFTNAVGPGTPVASISATTVSGGNGNGIVLGGDGTIQSLRRNTLTLGGNTTGDLSFAPGGSTAMTIRSNGNVGIGYANSSYKLTILGDTSNSAIGPLLISADGLTNSIGTALTLDAGTVGGHIWNFLSTGSGAGAGAGHFAFYDSTADAYRFDIDPNGRVGIGTNLFNQAATLDVRGNLGTIPAASVSANTSVAALIADNRGVGDLFTASSSGLNRFVITQAGNVGIGVTIPSAKLHIDQSHDFVGGLRIDSAADGFNSYALDIRSPENTSDVIYSGENRMFSVLAGSTFWNNPAMLVQAKNGSLISLAVGSNKTNIFKGTAAVASIAAQTSFATLVVDNSGVGDLFTASSSGLNRFVITQAGNVGIGTTNPLAMLHIDADGTTGTNIAAGLELNVMPKNPLISTNSAYARQVLNNQYPSDDVSLMGNYPAGTNTGFLVGNFDPGTLFSGFTSRAYDSYFGNFYNNWASATAPTSGQFINFDGDNDQIIISPTGQETAMFGRSNNNPNLIGGYFSISGDNTATSQVYANLSVTGKLGSITHSPIASISGRTVKAALMVDNMGPGDLFTASSSGLNRFVIKQSGNVGIGTTLPTTKLHILASQSSGATGSDSTVARLENSAASFSDVLSLVQSGEAGGTGSDFVEFHTNAGKVGDIDSNGAGTVNYNAFTGSHYAWANDTFEMSMLMSLTGDNTRINANPDSEIIYGIHLSSKENDPAILGSYMGIQDDIGIDRTRTYHSVAAVGNGEMWIIDTGSPIKRGDYLISSSTPGHARKDPRTAEVSHIVARVAEDIDWSTVTETINDIKHRKVSVLYEAFDRDNSMVISETGNISLFEKEGAPALDPASTYGVSMPDGSEVIRTGVFSDAVIGNLRTGSLDVQSLNLGGINLNDRLLGLESGFASASAGFANPISQLQAQVLSLSDRVASLEAQLTATNSALFMNNPLGGFTASTGAELSLDKLDVNGTIISDSLNVLSYATINELSVTGTIRTGLLTIKSLANGGASISTLNGDLKLQDLGFGGIDILDGAVTIDTSGNMQTVGEITAKKFNVDTASTLSASIGQATIPLNATNAIVNTTAVTSNSRIFVTPRTKTSIPLSVTTQTTGTSFKVEITSPAPQPIKFDWFIIN